MRRLYPLVAGVALLGAALGCHHTAGYCDCTRDCDPCYTYGRMHGDSGMLGGAAVNVAPADNAHPAPKPENKQEQQDQQGQPKAKEQPDK
jgi:hypothetical protein